MGIWAHLEVKRGVYLYLADGRCYSKAVATFISSLECYCNLQIASRRLDDNNKEIFEWFSTITSRMVEDLCLVGKIAYGFWEYSENDYERYFDNEKQAYERAKNFSLPSWLIDRPGADEYA